MIDGTRGSTEQNKRQNLVLWHSIEIRTNKTIVRLVRVTI